jgi:hypothetical protein
MSKFFVGCPVRIIYSIAFPELVGKTGRIIGVGTYTDNPSNRERGAVGKAGWSVKPDDWESDLCPRLINDKRTRFLAMEDQLDPIVPEGMRSTTWEKCLWQPQKNLVTT